jgi:hypothetical protein
MTSVVSTAIAINVDPQRFFDTVEYVRHVTSIVYDDVPLTSFPSALPFAMTLAVCSPVILATYFLDLKVFWPPSPPTVAPLATVSVAPFGNVTTTINPVISHPPGYDPSAGTVDT